MNEMMRGCTCAFVSFQLRILKQSLALLCEEAKKDSNVNSMAEVKEILKLINFNLIF